MWGQTSFCVARSYSVRPGLILWDPTSFCEVDTNLWGWPYPHSITSLIFTNSSLRNQASLRAPLARSWALCKLVPRSKDCFGIWKHLLNPIWVTETLNMPQKWYGKIYQPYCQYPVWAQDSGRAVYSLFMCLKCNLIWN